MPPYLDACHLDLLDLRRRLSRGAVVIFPTETFYGLGGAPQQATAARILALKGRREGRPLPLIAASPAVARTAVHLDPPARRLWDALTTRWWPGPLTLVARARSGFPPELLAGGQTVGVRVSSNETATTIAELCGGLTVATSANATGTPPALIADDAVAPFRGQVDLVVDGGRCAGGAPSTVVEIGPAGLRVLRPGAVDIGASP